MKTHIRGQVKELNFPKPKMLFDKYSISVETDEGSEMTFEVPTSDYKLGQTFEKEMMIGSLDILYSSN